MNQTPELKLVTDDAEKLKEPNPFQFFADLSNGKITEPVFTRDSLKKQLFLGIINNNDYYFLLNILIEYEGGNKYILNDVFRFRHILANKKDSQGYDNPRPDQDLFVRIHGLGCKNFPLTSLDISGYDLATLDLENGIIGGDLSMEGIRVRNDLNMRNTTIRGAVLQKRMEVGGNMRQDNMQTKYHVDQKNMKIAGDCNQASMQVGSDLEQNGAEIGGNLDQSNADIHFSVHQNSIRVGGDMNQRDMHGKYLSILEQNRAEIKGNLSQDKIIAEIMDLQQNGIKVGNILSQNEIRVRSICQDGMEAGAVNQDGIDVGDSVYQHNIIVERDIKQTNAIIRGNLYQAGAKIERDMHQQNMRIGGYVLQYRIHTRGLWQDETSIRGSLDQGYAKTTSVLSQNNIVVGGDILQTNMETLLLSQQRALIKGSLGQCNLQVGGLMEQGGIRVAGQVFQRHIKVGSICQNNAEFWEDVDQHNMGVSGTARQSGVFVRGKWIQEYIKIKENNLEQNGIHVGGSLEQYNAEINGNVEQNEAIFGDGVNQTKLQTGGRLSQCHLKSYNDVKQTDAKIACDAYQIGAIVYGDIIQDRAQAGSGFKQTEMHAVGGAIKQDGIIATEGGIDLTDAEADSILIRGSQIGGGINISRVKAATVIDLFGTLPIGTDECGEVMQVTVIKDGATTPKYIDPTGGIQELRLENMPTLQNADNKPPQQSLYELYQQFGITDPNMPPIPKGPVHLMPHIK